MSSTLLSLLKNSGQQGVFDHIAAIIRAQLDGPQQLNNVQSLEIVSKYIRESKFQFKQKLQDHHLNQYVNKPLSYPASVTYSQHLVSKLKNIDKGKIYAWPNIMEQFHVLKQAGISIGQKNFWALEKAIQTLAIQNQIVEINFWGKILGYKDYFVIKGKSSKPYAHTSEQHIEKYGEGVNTYSYWVTNNVLANWQELPLVSPQQVRASRQFKYFFTGDLERPILNYHQFVGSQKHLLKCVLARITHSCQLAPKGIYQLGDDGSNIVEFVEDFKIPEVIQMNSLENWVHFNPNILNQGRCSYYIDPKFSEEEKEALSSQLSEKDPIIERFRSIAEDKACQVLGLNSNWTVQACGQTVPINLVGRSQGQSTVYGVVLLKNTTWVGASTVGYKQKWFNIYVGYGERVNQEYNCIKQLGNLQAQGQDINENEEPNPAKPPPIIKQQEALEAKEGGKEEEAEEQEAD